MNYKRPFFSICIPTYNRANLLSRLFKSLIKQNFSDFEVVLCDDCSIDNTLDIVKKYEKKIKINYIKLNKNRGRAYALRETLINAKGKFTIIMDSDDYFIEDILSHIYKKLILLNNSKVCGIIGLCATPEGNILGTKFKYENCDKSLLELRCMDKIKGDKKEIIYTHIIKDVIYDIKDNERRVPTSLLWNRISHKYKICTDNNIYVIKDYLDNGMTKNISKIKSSNPTGISETYYEILQYKGKIRFLCKFKAGINMWRYFFHGAKIENIDNKNLIYKFLGYILYIKDKL